MPIFSFCAVVGAALLGLICFAEDMLGPPRQLAIVTSFYGLPKPFKADHTVEVQTVREVSSSPASALEQAFAQAPLAVVPPKKAAPADKSRKITKAKITKAVKVARTRTRSDSYAHMIGNDFTRMW